MTKERFLVPAYGADVNAVQVAVKALELLCEKHNSNGLVCVPALKHAEGTVLNRVWSEKHIKSLASGKVLNINEHHGVSMCSPFTLKSHHSAPIILALFASKDMVEKVENSSGCKALVVLPWIPEDTESWAKSYAPTVLSLPVIG
jgi:hypothetical protein